MTASFQSLGSGLYRLNGHFYHRPTLPSGQRTYRAIQPHPASIKAARLALHRLKYGQNGSGAGSALTLGHILREYAQAGYPDRHRVKRKGKGLSQEQSRCRLLVTYWDKFRTVALTLGGLDDFADWRIKHRTKQGFAGARAAELDLNSLRNALRWATRRGLVQQDPFAQLSIPRYRQLSDIRHCRECAPRSGDELHSLAAHLFEDTRSEVLGWLTLLTAMTGLRVSEIVNLRTDAAEGEPGYLDWASGLLWLRRAKKGTHNYLRLHPALRTALRQFFKWRSRHVKRAQSPHWFPGKNPARPVQEQSLSHALRRAGLLLFKEPRTAHGLRSFYVTVRRSMGVSDSEIALEIGQLSGGREIVRTYGEATPRKVSWLPAEGTPPAWQPLALATVGPPFAPRQPGRRKRAGTPPVAPG